MKNRQGLLACSPCGEARAMNSRQGLLACSSCGEAWSLNTRQGLLACSPCGEVWSMNTTQARTPVKQDLQCDYTCPRAKVSLMECCSSDHVWDLAMALLLAQQTENDIK